MLQTGDVYRIDIPNEKSDHYWIMVTEVDGDGNIAYAMLKDARILDFPTVVFPQGTPAWADFSRAKTTAVDAARSNIRAERSVRQALTVAGKYQGTAVPKFLEAVRDALRKAPETPSAVKTAM